MRLFLASSILLNLSIWLPIRFAPFEIKIKLNNLLMVLPEFR